MPRWVSTPRDLAAALQSTRAAGRDLWRLVNVLNRIPSRDQGTQQNSIPAAPGPAEAPTAGHAIDDDENSDRADTFPNNAELVADPGPTAPTDTGIVGGLKRAAGTILNPAAVLGVAVAPVRRIVGPGGRADNPTDSDTKLRIIGDQLITASQQPVAKPSRRHPAFGARSPTRNTMGSMAPREFWPRCAVKGGGITQDGRKDHGGQRDSRDQPCTWHPPTTVVDDRAGTLPDQVGRRFDRGTLNKVWTSELDTDEDWLYLCTVRDGCSRRALGFAFSDTLHTDVVETALRRAHLFRDSATGPLEGVIFHADRGCQYTSEQMYDVATELKVRQSVGRTWVCWDNAQQESFWSTLKTEFYQRWRFAARTEAIRACANWIETVYNSRRLHSSLGYLTPIEFEILMINQADQAA